MKNLFLLNRSGMGPDVMSRKGRYSLDPILSRLCVVSLIYANKLLNHRTTPLGRFVLPEHLPFSKPKVNWLLHVSLICVLMLTLGVGNAWGDVLYTEDWEADGHHRSSGTNSYTSNTYGDWTLTFADAVNSGSPLAGSYHAILRVAKKTTNSPSLISGALLSSSATITKVGWKCKGFSGCTLKVSYSTNGSTWTEKFSSTISSTAQDKSFNISPGVSGPIYLKFVVTVGSSTTGNRDANIDNITIEETAGTPTCATPTFSPAAGTYDQAQNVSISCATEGATIHYTTNGNDPTESSSTYSSAISVTSTTTIKAKAFKSGYTESSVASATYTLQCTAPTFDNAAGTYCGASLNVKVSNYNSNYTYYYTTNGNDPTNASTAYNHSTGIELSATGSSQTLKMIAYRGTITSTVTSAAYTITNIANTQETAYTVAQARALIDANVCLTQAVYVKGYVKEITTAFNGTYGNISFDITDNSNGTGDTFRFYRNFKGAGNTKWASADEAPQEGNYVIGYGTLTKYNSTYEFAEGNYCVVNSATAYTITAVSNNNSYGTVALSGSTITATPNSGYRVSTTTAYTISPAGSATVTDNGDNTFTVTPSANTTITINFEAIPTHTLTFSINGGSCATSSVSVAEGATYTPLPTVTGLTSSCEYGTFVGWTTESSTYVHGTSSLYTTSYEMGNANVTLHAVYSKTSGGGGGDYELVESDLGTDWAGDYLIAFSSTVFADGSVGGTSGIGMQSNQVNPSTNLSGTSVASSWGDDYYVTLEEISSGSNTYVLKTQDNNYNYYTSNSSNGLSSTGSKGTAANYPITVTFTSSSDVKLCLGGGAAGSVFRFNNATTASGGQMFRFYKNCGQSAVYLYKKSSGTTTYSLTANCCTSWDPPTVSYSSSLAINASEGVTIGSGTTHGAVTYESSDEDVLTVTSDGTITAVGAGTAHIIATWAGETISSTTYCEKSANSNDVTVSGIQVTGTTPVNFGQVYQNAVVANKTIYVTGLGLASAIMPSLPVGSPFSFSPASLAKDCSGATLTISASTATIGDYNQTLTLTSGAFSATATVKMEVIAMPTATFTDALHNLTEDKDGVSLSSYNLTAAQGTAVVFPRLANQTKSAGTCEGEYYIFVGWTEGDNNTDPQDHLVTSYTLANGDTKNYYAVWADASGSATYTKLTSNSFSTSAHYVIGAESGGTDYFLYSCEKTDQNNSWGYVSSDPSTDAPIQFTLSGSASELVVASTEATTRYLKAASGKQFFGMSSSSTTVVLGSDGTIESTADTYNNLRYNSAGGLRWYTGTTTGDAAYFYEVGSSGTVHYRTSCCANKVDAPVVTATAVTSTSITLTWPSDAKATGWQIEWNGAGGWVTPSGSCTHTVSGLTPNTTYTWRVRATYEDPVCGADVRSGSTTTNQVYHVTYAKGSGTGTCTAEGSTTDETDYEAGATVTLQENGFSLSGHTFAGWTEDDDDITISSNQFTMPDHDVVITASWTAKMDKYFDRMHDQTDALHGGVEETEGTNEGKYYIPKEGCSYSVPTAVDSKTGDACQTSHYKLRGWIAASYVNSKGEITDESKIFSPTSRPTWTATGATYYAVWAEVTE